MASKRAGFNVRVDEHLLELIQDACKRTGLSQQTVLRRALQIGLSCVAASIKTKPKVTGSSQIKICFRKGSHPVATAGRPITTAEIKAFLNDYP